MATYLKDAAQHQPHPGPSVPEWWERAKPLCWWCHSANVRPIPSHIGGSEYWHCKTCGREFRKS